MTVYAHMQDKFIHMWHNSYYRQEVGPHKQPAHPHVDPQRKRPRQNLAPKRKSRVETILMRCYCERMIPLYSGGRVYFVVGERVGKRAHVVLDWFTGYPFHISVILLFKTLVGAGIEHIVYKRD